MEAIVLLFPLAGMVYEDFKRRSIPVWLLLLFGALQVGVSVWREGIRMVGVHLLSNLLMMCIIGTTVALYCYLRFRGKRRVIGWGDILFIAFLTPCLELRTFLLFLIVSLTFTLVGWMLFLLTDKREQREIPLVSGIGICYGAFILYEILGTP
ncbi:MAG: hypothetical protein LBN06_02495 [Prevotellaceae bacterium]|jgi:Flp pilus assembly protein protease CpaA|nr:hypothetical protein [Prevotellaceae bacterium]